MNVEELGPAIKGKPLPLCKKHGKPILPSYIKGGCKTLGCSDCKKETNAKVRTRKMKDKRAKEWDSIFIGCIHHPEKPCNRACYKYSGAKYCRSCARRNKKTGELNKSYLSNEKRRQESGHKADLQRSWRRWRRLMAAY